MLGRRSIGRAVDLGCGPGELTALAAERLDVEKIVGIDNARRCWPRRPHMPPTASDSSTATSRRGQRITITTSCSPRQVCSGCQTTQRCWPAGPRRSHRADHSPSGARQRSCSDPHGRSGGRSPRAVPLGLRCGRPADRPRCRVRAAPRRLRPAAVPARLRRHRRALRVYPARVADTAARRRMGEGHHAHPLSQAARTGRVRSIPGRLRAANSIAELGSDEPCFFPFSRILFVARRP